MAANALPRLLESQIDEPDIEDDASAYAVEDIHNMTHFKVEMKVELPKIQSVLSAKIEDTNCRQLAKTPMPPTVYILTTNSVLF